MIGRLEPLPVRCAALAVAALTYGGAALAADGRRIIEQGSFGGAPACISCHGADLGGSGAVPAIAGRPAAFILARLAHYAGPTGKNPAMRLVARALSPDEAQAVAAYIASLPRPPPRAPS